MACNFNTKKLVKSTCTHISFTFEDMVCAWGNICETDDTLKFIPTSETFEFSRYLCLLSKDAPLQLSRPTGDSWLWNYLKLSKAFGSLRQPLQPHISHLSSFSCQQMIDYKRRAKRGAEFFLKRKRAHLKRPAGEKTCLESFSKTTHQISTRSSQKGTSNQQNC